MRSQQKSFVVEIKSKGRRSAARQGSIWGTTDLKAVARQAANVAPQLFETTDDVAVTMDVILSRPHDPPVPASLGIADQHDSSNHVQIVSVEPIETQTAPTEAVSLSVPKDPVQTRKSDAPRRARKYSRVKTTAAKVDAPQAINASDEYTDGELELLEAENARLKSLWAEQLRGQNQRLRVMLERVQSA